MLECQVAPTSRAYARVTVRQNRDSDHSCRAPYQTSDVLTYIGHRKSPVRTRKSYQGLHRRAEALFGPFRIFFIEEKERCIECDGALAHFNLSPVMPEMPFSGDEYNTGIHHQLELFPSNHSLNREDLHVGMGADKVSLSLPPKSTPSNKCPTTSSRRRSKAPILLITKVLFLEIVVFNFLALRMLCKTI